MTHTPGPWKVDGYRIHTGDEQYPAYRTIAKVNVVNFGDFWAVEETAEANARLIAAAPALLEALELAEATIARLTIRHGPFSSTDGTLSIARAAIALAKGEEVTA